MQYTTPSLKSNKITLSMMNIYTVTLCKSAKWTIIKKELQRKGRKWGQEVIPGASTATCNVLNRMVTKQVFILLLCNYCILNYFTIVKKIYSFLTF